MSDLDHYNSHVEYSSIANNPAGITLLRTVFGPIGFPLLDVGCGTGLWLGQFNENAIGIDFSRARISEARKRYIQHDFYVADIAKWLASPYNNLDFDTISCFEVLEHLDNPISLLRAMAERCRRVIVTVPVRNYAKTHKHFYTGAKQVEKAFPGIKVLHSTAKNVFFEYKV